MISRRYSEGVTERIVAPGMANDNRSVEVSKRRQRKRISIFLVCRVLLASPRLYIEFFRVAGLDILFIGCDREGSQFNVG